MNPLFFDRKSLDTPRAKKLQCQNLKSMRNFSATFRQKLAEESVEKKSAKSVEGFYFRRPCQGISDFTLFLGLTPSIEWITQHQTFKFPSAVRYILMEMSFRKMKFGNVDSVVMLSTISRKLYDIYGHISLRSLSLEAQLGYPLTCSLPVNGDSWCPECRIGLGKFKENEHFRLHQVAKEWPFRLCYICDEILHESEFEDHQITHLKIKFNCLNCSYVTFSPKKLRKHRKTCLNVAVIRKVIENLQKLRRNFRRY